MRVPGVIFAVAAFGVLAWCRAEMRVEVNGTTKPIQRDGFLLEWRPASATVVDSSRDVRCDAVNTKEGLSGYIRYAAPDTCWQWRWRIYPNVGAWQRYMEIQVDSAGMGRPLHAIDRVAKDSYMHVAVEWVLAWDSLDIDSAGGYSVGFSGVSNCGDTAQAFVVAGTYVQNAYQGVWTPRLKMQVWVIAVLLALYLVVYSRSKKYRRRSRELKR